MIVEKSKCDPELGRKVVNHLRSIGMLGCEKEHQLPMEEKIAIATPKMAEVLDTMGFNLNDPNTNETAKRWVKMMVQDLLWGMYAETFPKMKLIPTDDIGYDDMVFMSVTAQSMCSHHLQVMWGDKGCADGSVMIGGGAVVAYIPKNVVLGLSKLNKIVEWCGKRAQCEEQYVRMVVEVISFLTGAPAACMMNLKHGCVSFRSVEDKASSTTCFYCTPNSEFTNNPQLRKEFLSMAHKKL